MLRTFIIIISYAHITSHFFYGNIPYKKKHPIRLDFAVSMTIFIFMYDINSKLRENSITA